MFLRMVGDVVMDSKVAKFVATTFYDVYINYVYTVFSPMNDSF